MRRLDGPPLPVVSEQEASDGTIVVQHGSGQIVLWWPDSDDIGSEVVGPVGFTGLAQVVDERVMVAVAGRVVEIPLDVAEWRAMACASARGPIDPSRWRAATGTDPPETPPCEL